MGEGLLVVAEMTQRQLLPPKPTPACVTAHGSWKPGAHCMACRQLNRLESLFLAVGLVSAFSRQLRWSEPHVGNFSCLKYLSAVFPAYAWKGGASAAGQFQGLPKTSELFVSCALRSLPLEHPKS